jgi:hypothetical protein
MLNTPKEHNDVILAITQFHSSDLLQEEIQQLPNNLQEIFDFVLDTHYGDNIETRRKMLRIKELISNYAQALKPFSEAQVQQSCANYQEIIN